LHVCEPHQTTCTASSQVTRWIAPQHDAAQQDVFDFYSMFVFPYPAASGIQRPDPAMRTFFHQAR
jgi:hypothetical protein